MAKKYHINDKDKVGICTAKDGGCQFSSLNHFDNEDDANKRAEQIMDKKHGTINSLQKSKKYSAKNNRAYSIYKKIRKINRGGGTREYAQGSYFNNAVKAAAKRLNLSMDEARTKIYEGYAEENGITVEKAKENFEKLKDHRIERDTEEKEIREFYDNNSINSLMEKYEQEHGKLRDPEDFEEYREWRDEYVYEELKKIRASKDKYYNNIRKMRPENVEEFEDKLHDLTNGAIGFEQHEYTKEDGEKIVYDSITFNDESDIDYIIYKKDGKYFVKEDYSMKNEEGFKPLESKQLEPDELLRHTEDYLVASENVKISYFDKDNNGDEIYVKDFAQHHFLEASQILKKRYNIE